MQVGELKRTGILVQDIVKLLQGTVGRHMSPVVARPQSLFAPSMPLFPGPCRLQLGSDNDRLTGLVSAIDGNTDILIRRILVSLLSADLGPHMLKYHPWMPER
jgi:hypothetical protein